jgi:fructokinase
MDYLTTARQDAHQTLDVMVVGEALIDVVTTSHDTVEHPGGSPANVAYGLGRLAVTTGLLTAIARLLPKNTAHWIHRHLP